MALVKDAYGRETQPSSGSGSTIRFVADKPMQETTAVDTTVRPTGPGVFSSGRKKLIGTGDGVNILAASLARPENQEWKRSLRNAGSKVSGTGKSAYETYADAELYYRQHGEDADWVQELKASDPYYETDLANYKAERNRRFELNGGKWQLATESGKADEFSSDIDYKIWDIRNNGFNGFDFMDVQTIYGTTYRMPRAEISWIQSRFAKDLQDETYEAYGYYGDEDDQRRKKEGQHSRKLTKIYNSNDADRYLAQIDMPPSQSIDYYHGEYFKWLGDGLYDFTADKDFYEYATTTFQRGWKYGETPNDISARLEGSMPEKQAAKYKDKNGNFLTAQDEFNYDHNLPPTADMPEVVGSWGVYVNNLRRVNALYAAVSDSIVNLQLDGISNDDTKYTNEDGTTNTGAELWQKAYTDILDRDDWADVRDFVNAPEDEAKPLERKPEWSDADFFEAQVAAENEAKAAEDKVDPYAIAVSYDGFLDYFDTASPEIRNKKIAESVADKVFYAADGQAVVFDEEAKSMTVGEAIDQATSKRKNAADQELYASITDKNSVLKYVDERHGDRPIDILGDLYFNGVNMQQVRQAKNYLLNAAETSDQKEAVKSAFDQIKDTRTANRLENAYLWATDSDGSRAERRAANKAERQNNREMLDRYGKGLRQAVADYSDPAKLNSAIADLQAGLEYDGSGKATGESVARSLDGLNQAGYSAKEIRHASSIVLGALNRAGLADIVGFDPNAAHEANRPATVDEYQSAVADGDALTTNIAIKNAVAAAEMREWGSVLEAGRAQAIEAGYTNLQYDNMCRRLDYGEALDPEASAYNYFVEKGVRGYLEQNGEDVAAFDAMSEEAQRQRGVDIWNSWTDEEKKAQVEWFKDTEKFNPDIHKSTIDQVVDWAGVRWMTKLTTGLLSGAVSLADMAAGWVGGNSEQWEITKTLSEIAGQAANYGVGAKNQGDGTGTITTMTNVFDEITRRYVLGSVGGVVGKAFTPLTNPVKKLAASAANNGLVGKGVGKLLNLAAGMPAKIPFMAAATGSNYSQAMAMGATKEQATKYGLVTGIFEGITEGMNAEHWVSVGLGGRKLAENLVRGAAEYRTIKGIVPKAAATKLLSSFLGEAVEEAASYGVGVWQMRKTGINPDEKFDFEQMLQEAAMGGLVGLFGAGMSLSQTSTMTGIAYQYMADNGYDSDSFDIFEAAARVALGLTQEQIEQISKSAEVLSKEGLDQTNASIAQAARNIHNNNINYPSQIEALGREVTSREELVSSLRQQIAQVKNDPKTLGKLFGQLTEAMRALDDATGELANIKKSYADSNWQNQRAIEKGRATLDGHYVGMYNLFQTDIAAMRDMSIAQMQAARAAGEIDGASDEIDAKYAPGIIAENAAFDAAMTATTEFYNAEELASTAAATMEQAKVVLSQTREKMQHARAGTLKKYQEAAKLAAVEMQEQMQQRDADLDAGMGELTSYNKVTVEQEQRAVDAGKRLGVPVVVEDFDNDNDHGYYVSDDGTIHINRNQQVDAHGNFANDSPTMIVFKHEFTHFLESSSEYGAFADFVMERAKQQHGDQFDDYYAWFCNTIQADRENNGRSALDEPGLQREFVARFAEKNLLFNDDAIKALVRERGGLAGRALNWIQYQIANGMLRKSDDADAKAMLEAERLYVKTFRDAGKKPSIESTEYYVTKTTSGQPAAVIETNILDGVAQSDWVRTVVAELKIKFPDGITVGQQQIAIDRQTRKELTHSKPSNYMFAHDPAMFADKMNAAVNADDVLAASTDYVNEQPKHPRRDNITDFGRGKILLRIGNSDYTADVIVAHTSDDRLKLYDIVEMKKAKHSLRQYSAGAADANSSPAVDDGDRLTAPFNNSMPQADENVNTDSAETTPRRYSSSLDLSWDAYVKSQGAQPTGMQPRARDIAVPRRTASNNRVSSFVRSAAESRHIPDAWLYDLSDAVVNDGLGIYVPQENSVLEQKQRDYISEIGLTAAQKEFDNAVRNGTISDANTALGLQLLAEASARGDKDAALVLIANICIYSTEAGRAVQAFAMLKNMGGVGAAVYAQKLLNRLNAQYAEQIASGKMQPITLPQGIFDRFMDAKTQQEIGAIEEDMFADIGQQLPLTFKDKLRNWRYFAMLANPTTHARNFFGNVLMYGARAAKDAVATGIERGAAAMGLINESDMTHAVYNRFSAENRPFVDFAKNEYELHATDLLAGGKYGFDTLANKNKRLFDQRTLNAIAKFNNQMLEKEDAVFLSASFQDAYVQFLKARGLSPDTITEAQKHEAAEWASSEAWRATFRDASAVADWLSSGIKMKGTAGAVAGTIIEGVMPFKKTPINIAKRGIDYSPIGLIEGAVMLAKDVKAGKSPAAAIDRFASGLVGSGLVALGAFLAKMKILRGAGEDEKEYEKYLQATGEQPYSLKIGDASFDMSGIAPMTIPLFVGVALYEAYEDDDRRNGEGGGVNIGEILEIIGKVADPLMEMSFMASLGSAIKAYAGQSTSESIGSVFGSAASSLAGQFVPTIGGKIARAFDSTDRTTNADAKNPILDSTTIDSFARGIAQKVPGLSSELQPYVNAKGERSTQDGFGEWALDFANQFILPSRVKITNRDSVDREIIRVYESTGRVDIFPTSPSKKKFTVNKVDYYMNARQFTNYCEDRGEASYAAIKDVMRSNGYKSMTDSEIAEAFKKAVEAAEKQVDSMYKEKLGALD